MAHMLEPAHTNAHVKQGTQVAVLGLESPKQEHRSVFAMVELMQSRPQKGM